MIFIYSIKQGFHRKIGITNNPKQRLKTIKSTYRSASFSVILPTPFVAGFIEKMFHSLLAWFRITRKGSGKTEWFRLWPFGWLVDLLITVAVLVPWWGLYLALNWLVKTY